MTADITPYLQQLRELLPDGPKCDPLRLLVLEECDGNQSRGSGGTCGAQWCGYCHGTKLVLRRQWQELRQQGLIGGFEGTLRQTMMEPELQVRWLQRLDALMIAGCEDIDIAAAQALIEALKEGSHA